MVDSPSFFCDASLCGAMRVLRADRSRGAMSGPIGAANRHPRGQRRVQRDLQAILRLHLVDKLLPRPKPFVRPRGTWRNRCPSRDRDTTPRNCRPRPWRPRSRQSPSCNGGADRPRRLAHVVELLPMHRRVEVLGEAAALFVQHRRETHTSPGRIRPPRSGSASLPGGRFVPARCGPSRTVSPSIMHGAAETQLCAVVPLVRREHAPLHVLLVELENAQRMRAVRPCPAFRLPMVGRDASRIARRTRT